MMGIIWLWIAGAGLAALALESVGSAFALFVIAALLIKVS